MAKRLGHATTAAAMVYLHARTVPDAELAAALTEAMLGERDCADAFHQGLHR